MDNITSKLLDDIDGLREDISADNSGSIAHYYKLLFEYHLRLMFACLWERKELRISRELREKIIGDMSKPVLGTELNFILALNKTGDPVFDLPAGYETLIRKFINIRNQYFAHGNLIPLVHEESYKELCDELEKYYRRLAVFEQNFWGDDCEFSLRTGNVNQIIVFKPNKRPKFTIIDGTMAENYLPHELYFACKAGEFQVSPFLLAVKNNVTKYSFYFYKEYKDQSGKFDYYRVYEIGDGYEYSKTFPGFFTGHRKENKYTIDRGNGVVSNKFENNYDYFVDIAPFTKYVTQIWEFLIKNQSNTCLTIRGGGGIGKTALVQYICTKYLFERVKNPEFNYVIFCSAKDREYRLNTMTRRGEIYRIDEEKIIDSYHKILLTACRVWESEIDSTEENLPALEEAFLKESRVLLIIDDFETLPDTEKEKVVRLIERMNINRHKVLITTRSQYLVGSTCDVEPMNAEQVISFMEQHFDNITNSNPSVKEQFRNLTRSVTRKKIYEVTTGLPLLAIQLASLLLRKGFDERLLSEEFTQKFIRNAEDFLLGRLYSYFATPTSKLLFLLIAYFVSYRLQEIPLPTLKIFYDLHCRRFNFTNVDFNNDLKELKRWNIIRIEDDFIPVSNNISHEIFNECRRKFRVEYPSENMFDERLFRSVAVNGLRGVLDYIDAFDALVDEPLTEIFAFENVGKFTNDERCRVVEASIVHCNGDLEKIRALCTRGESYFDSYEGFFRLFESCGMCSAHENLAKKSSSQAEKNPPAVGGFENLNQKLKNIQVKLDEIFNNKQRPTRAYMENFYQQLRDELGQICAVDLKNALENFSPEDVPAAQATEQLLHRINKNQPFTFIRHENCQALFERLNNVGD